MRDNEPQDSPDVSRKSRSRSTSVSSKANSKRSGESKSSYSKSRSRSRSVNSDIDGYRLHIADIGDDVRKSDLEKFFSQFGTLKELWMTNSAPCFGFAVYKDKKSASAALKAADGAEFGGSRIRVSNARPRTRGSGRRFFNPNMRCYQCGYSGHFYRDCPELGNGKDSRHMGCLNVTIRTTTAIVGAVEKETVTTIQIAITEEDVDLRVVTTITEDIEVVDEIVIKCTFVILDTVCFFCVCMGVVFVDK